MKWASYNNSMAPRNARPGASRRVRGLCLVPLLAVLALAGCGEERDHAERSGPESERKGANTGLPRGYVERLEATINGQTLFFGPFIGYYFTPADVGDFSELEFVCYNERSWYTKDLPPGARLFTGKAVLATLPGGELPEPVGRVTPTYPEDQPESWTATRPGSAFLHFHSLHDAAGPARAGYWLKHVAVAGFTYDMGGRVGPGSILYHEVDTGVDKDFAPLIEFDAGPDSPAEQAARRDGPAPH